MSTGRATKSGLAREAQAKISAKYEPDLAAQCLEWILDTINSSLTPGQDRVTFSTSGDEENLSKVLRDGYYLARMANALKPGSVAKGKLAKPPTMAFKQMELISLFTTVCKDLGVPDIEVFQTVDLFEAQNLHQVVMCLQSLGRKCKARGLGGFGPKEADAHHREFTDEQLRAGDTIIGLQMGTNKLASQAGMNFGKSRHIVD